MRIGVPREVKDGEKRVALTPQGASDLQRRGHEVRVQSGAGMGAGFDDAEYVAAGAHLVEGARDVYACALVVKVKELQPAELVHLEPGSTIFGFTQLGRDPPMLRRLLARGITLVGYEAVSPDGTSRPLLEPMSRIAGALAPLVGGRLLLGDGPGRGILLEGGEGGAAARVVVIGAGAVGSAAIRRCVALGCSVSVLVRSSTRLEEVQRRFGNAVVVRVTSPDSLAETLGRADLVISGLLVPGRQSPKLIDRGLLRTMPPGSVLMDIGIDQGGIAETSRMTSIGTPTFVEEGVIHYCVPNMPALVPRSASLALATAVLPFVVRLAGGVEEALTQDPALGAGVQIRDGLVVHPGLAAEQAAVPPVRLSGLAA